MMIPFSLAIIILSIFTQSFLFSQITLETQDDDGPITNNKICYAYSFSKGDTLEYLIHSYDSITFPKTPDVLKARKEIVEIICDSVSAKGHFFLRHTLKSVDIIETTHGSKTLHHTKHPWIGKTATIEIDSLGNRYTWKLGDSSKAVLSPGGAFQPVLFFPIKQNCSRENSTWLVETEDYYPENGIPVSYCNYGALFRTSKSLDTLGFACNRLQYAKTAKSGVDLLQIGTKTSIFVVSNSFGKLAIGTKYKVPVHFFSTIEQKLQITNDTNPDEIITGKHHITSNTTLLRLNQIRNTFVNE
jgi:hypothetical protein